MYIRICKVLNKRELKRHKRKLSVHLGKALENKEFKVYLQPKYDPVSEKVVGAEALVRWDSPEQGLLTPDRFVPLLEENGLIPLLDDYMILRVAELLKQWLTQKGKVLPVSVNISRTHFLKPELSEHICALVDRIGIPHRLLELELTESAFFEDKNVLTDTVKELQKCGFAVAMDDFGSGYSSLNSLKDIPIDVLKMDADFFRGELNNPRGEIVISEMIHLAKLLHMYIVAEGVEKKEQVDFLAQNGCDMIQGYYYAPPMTVGAFESKFVMIQSHADL